MRAAIRPCVTWLSWLTVATLVAGETAPEPLISTAQAVLRINDLAWLERTAAQFATTSGGSPDRVRAQIAQSLFATRTLEGIDTSRAAVLAWREGPAPWTAVIPLKDRQRFLDEFGVAHADDGPMVRVGERNGTTVYTQNTRSGLWEYRLLMQDNTAFIARSVDECQQLAARHWRPATGAAPLAFRATGGWVAAADRLVTVAPLLPDRFTDLVLPTGWPFISLRRDWREVMEHVATVVWEIKPGAQGDIHWRLTAQPKAESLLAQWVAGQKNQGSRLIAAVRTPDTIAVGYGRVVWQGHLERWLQGHLERERLGADGKPLPPETDDLLRTTTAVWDGAGAFAYAAELVKHSSTLVRYDRRLLVETPRASELVAAERTRDRLATQAGGVRLANGTPVALTHADAVLAGWNGYRCELTVAERRFGEIVTLGNDQFAAFVSAAPDAGQPAIQRVVDQAAVKIAPEGVPALVGVQIRCTQWVRALLRERGEEPPPLAEVDAGLALISTAQGDLVIEARLPLSRLAVVVRDSGITAERAAATPTYLPK